MLKVFFLLYSEQIMTKIPTFGRYLVKAKDFLCYFGLIRFLTHRLLIEVVLHQ